MSNSEQLTGDPAWPVEAVALGRSGAQDIDSRTAVLDRGVGGESASSCRTIELFPAGAPRKDSAPRPKKRTREVTFTEGLTILMLTAATCIALFGALGYLCR